METEARLSAKLKSNRRLMRLRTWRHIGWPPSRWPQRYGSQRSRMMTAPEDLSDARDRFLSL
jgi:hypothetical protein